MEEKKFFDFKSNEAFNLDAEYKTIFGEQTFKPSNPNDDKLKDAEVIIAELGAKYMEGLSLQEYENIFLNLNAFLIKFRVDSDEVKNMTKDDRDKLFGYGKELFAAYQNQYSNLYFNFELSVKEWNYIENVLTRKMLYNGQELFNYWELYSKFIEPTKEMVSKLPKQLQSFVPICSIQNLILLSHLLMKHEEKGSTEQFHNFRVVLTEIAKMTRLFNAYGVMLERETSMFNNWVNALNAMDEYNDYNKVDETK
jgi:hypothetical protein